MFKKVLLGALAATAFALPAVAQDYVVGVTAALTGPPSSTYAPAVDAMRIYIDRVNAAGGINGRKIKLVIEDDGAQPSKAAANTKKLITQDNVVLMVNASLSSTYAPVIAESKSENVPLLFASGVCPQSVYPPADPLQFCTTGYASHFDSQATLDFIKATAKGPVKIGFSAMAIPLSRGEMDYAMELSKKEGMEPVDQQVIPQPTADYTPFATKLNGFDGFRIAREILVFQLEHRQARRNVADAFDGRERETGSGHLKREALADEPRQLRLIVEDVRGRHHAAGAVTEKVHRQTGVS